MRRVTLAQQVPVLLVHGLWDSLARIEAAYCVALTASIAYRFHFTAG